VTFGTRERIVELCSAADVLEAYTLRSRLEEAGIRCRVVGELLAGGACSMALGETVTPRIWVREEDATRAREIVDEWTRPFRLSGDAGAPDELTELKEEDGSPAPASGWRWLGGSLAFAGVAVILFGTVVAWQNWIMLHHCSAETRGVFVCCLSHWSTPPVSPPEIPAVSQLPAYSVWYDACYTFVADDKTYFSVDHGSRHARADMPIHYDPHHPTTNYAGALTSPRGVLAGTLGTGATLFLAGRLLSRTRRNRGARRLAAHR
jgi:hypothetical protein